MVGWFALRTSPSPSEVSGDGIIGAPMIAPTSKCLLRRQTWSQRDQVHRIISPQMIHRVREAGHDFLTRFQCADADVGVAFGADGVRHF